MPTYLLTQSDKETFIRLIEDRDMPQNPKLSQDDVKKQYIVYKTTTNFAYIEPKKIHLRLSLNRGAEEINDPKGLCKDITNVSRLGRGDLEASLSSLNQIDDVLFLVRQAFKKHSDEFED